MEKFLNFNSKVQELAGKITAFLTFLLVLLVTGDVIGRYLFHYGSVAAQELEWHIFSIIFLLAAGYTFKLGDHVKVDVFYAKFSEKNRALIDILGTIVFLFAFCGFVIWFSAGFVAASFSINEASADPGGLPARFLLKAFIPLGFIMLAMQGVAFLHDAVNRYKNAAKIEKDKV